MTNKCPNCGFTIYNRRFPKCESCNAPLSQDVVFSEQERRALFEKDRQEADDAWRAKQATEQRRTREAKDKDTGGDSDVGWLDIADLFDGTD